MTYERKKTKNPRMAAAMAEAGLTGCDLAEITGLSRNTISGILCYRNFPKPETIEKIAKALRVNPDSLGIA